VADTDPTPSSGADASPEEPKKSRAGRDLPAAIAVGAFLGFGVIAILIFAPLWWIPVVAAAMAVASYEVVRRLRTEGYAIPLVPLIVGGQAMIWLSWPFGTEGILGSLLVTVLGCFVWRMRLGAAGFVRDVGASMLVLCWIPLCMAFGAMLVVPPDGRARVLTFLIIVVCSDTGGYAAGVLFGKHPMAPKVSPKKSWEGLAGSMVLGSTGGALSLMFLLHAPWWFGLILGPLLVCTAVIGDLVESLIKRDLGIKDMGNTIPGHGGLMERLDSLVTSAPVAWLLLFVLVPVVT